MLTRPSALMRAIERLAVVVDAAQQHRLVAHVDAFGVQLAHRCLDDRRHLVGVIEVRVHAHVLEHLAAALDDLDDGAEPLGIRQHLLRQHRDRLGGEPDALDVRDVEQRVNEQADVGRLQARDVAAGNDHVLDLRIDADVLERRRPVLRARHVGLLHHGRVLADGVAARAVLAVDRAYAR